MSANLLERVTPGPWHGKGFARKDSNFGGYAALVHGPEIARVAKVYGGNADDRQVCEANAELIALAYDHALFGAAVAAEAVKLTQMLGNNVLILVCPLNCAPPTWRGAVKLDAAGCPALTPELREALRRAIGIEASNG